MNLRPSLILILSCGPLFAGDPEDIAAPPLGPLIAAPSSEMAPVVDQWSADRRAVARGFPVDLSEARRERLRRFDRAWRDRLGDLDFDDLSLEAKVDYLLLDNDLKANLAQLDRDQRQAEEIAPFLPFAETIAGLVEARRLLEPLDSEAAADALAKIRDKADEARKAIEARKDDDKVARAVAVRAAGSADDLRSALSQWFRHYDGYDPLFSWWNRDPYRKADEALRDHVKLLREKVAGIKEGDTDAIVGDPIGREGLLEDLRAEMIAYSPEELLAIGEREFAWCEKELRKAASEMGFGDDWKAALEKVKTQHVKPGEQPALVRMLAEEAIKFVEDNDLVTVPALAKEDWPLEMMSAEAQKVNPFFLGGDRIIVSYPTDKMDYADKKMSMRSNNIPFSRATVHHELIPGHHLQFFMNQRHNTHRRPFGTPFWTEGWSLYWEMLLWDKGFPKTPEDRMGMLFWRTHRCARIVFSLKFHLGEMTPEQAIDFLVDRVGHERFSASGEVRRSFAGNYSPLYQAAYMMGGLQIRALHEDLVVAGKMTDREFHDRILTGNAMPIEMVRVRLTDAKVSRDFEPKWKFAGENLLKTKDGDQAKATSEP